MFTNSVHASGSQGVKSDLPKESSSLQGRAVALLKNSMTYVCLGLATAAAVSVLATSTFAFLLLHPLLVAGTVFTVVLLSKFSAMAFLCTIAFSLNMLAALPL